jgi:hypothetical protein
MLQYTQELLTPLLFCKSWSLQGMYNQICAESNSGFPMPEIGLFRMLNRNNTLDQTPSFSLLS